MFKSKFAIFFAMLMLWNVSANAGIYDKTYKKIEFERTSENLVINGPIDGDTVQQSITLNIDKVGYYDDVREVYVEVTDLVCPKGNGYGSPADWKGYFEYGFYDYRNRAEALADAVKGIGNKSKTSYAPQLVRDRDFLRSEPETWSEFISELREAEARNPSGLSGLTQRVLNYPENKNNLGYGYNSSSKGLCREVVVDAYYTNEVFEDSEVLDTVQMTVPVRVEGLILLPGESQVLSVVFNNILYGQSPEMSIGVDYRSKHSILSFSNVGSKEDPRLEAYLKRNKSRSSVDTISLNAFKSKNSNKLSFKLVDSLSGMKPEYLGELELKLELKRYSWWRFDPIIEEVYLQVPVGANPFVYEFASSLESDETYYVEYEIRRLHSKVFSPKFSSDKESNQVNY